MNGKDPETQDNKISRLQFLRLLGAGAIGYFAYRAGFISSLFGNATAATVGSIAGIPMSQSGAVSRALLDIF
jgi:hypothetical protein